MRDLEKWRAGIKKWQLAHPEKRRSYEKKRRAKNPLCDRFATAKRVAKQKGMQFDLTVEQYASIVAMPCHYCTNRLAPPSRASGLDRRDNTRGYTIDNVVSCCKFCNAIKSSLLTEEEALVAIRAIVALRSM